MLSVGGASEGLTDVGTESRRDSKVRQQTGSDSILTWVPKGSHGCSPLMGISPQPKASVPLCPVDPIERETVHTAPGSLSRNSLTLENHPREVKRNTGACCDLHQPPGVADVSVLEGRPNCTRGKGFWEISMCPTPSCQFCSNCSGGGKDWAIHTDREQTAGPGWWLCTLHYAHCSSGIRPLVQSGQGGLLAQAHPSPTGSSLVPEPFFSCTVPPCSFSQTREAQSGGCVLSSSWRRRAPAPPCEEMASASP